MLKFIHQAEKEALVDKIVINKNKLIYYSSEEIGQLVKGKRESM
jgi:hypothetical protein